MPRQELCIYCSMSEKTLGGTIGAMRASATPGATADSHDDRSRGGWSVAGSSGDYSCGGWSDAVAVVGAMQAAAYGLEWRALPPVAAPQSTAVAVPRLVALVPQPAAVAAPGTQPIVADVGLDAKMLRESR